VVIGKSIRVESGRDFPIVVTIGVKEYPLSLRFIYDVLYGFETVGSCIYGLFQFAHQLHEQLPPELAKAAETKPSIHYVSTIKQAMKLAQDTKQSEDDLVAITPDLLSTLQRRHAISKPKTSPGRGWSSYAIATMAELRRLLDQLHSDNR